MGTTGQDQTLLTDEGRYRRLIEAVIDYAIYMLDPRGIVASWNAGAQRIKGYTAAEILGQSFARFYTEEDRRSGLPERALGIAAREGRFEAEGWRVRKDGTRFWANVVIEPVRDARGGLIGFAKVTRDITEKKEAQAALDEARKALFQSQKQEAIGRLTGGVAHDFNNLLMAIIGSLELVSNRLPDDAKTLRLVANAIQAAERGASLTQRMLAFARRQELSPQPTDIPALVHGMADLLQRSLGATIGIETRFPLNLAPALADPNQLELALLNLATNARDAMGGEGRIVIAAREQTVESGPNLTPGLYICLSVTDTGEGMDEATLARASEPFFTTKELGKGTGLGLSMVHGFAEQLGGRLALHSARNQGTTAELWLPAAPRNAALGDDAAVAGKDVAKRALSVLAVDDDAMVLDTTGAMLEALGHRVFRADSGQAALAILRTQRIDLLISDQFMPQMTGTELAATIRAERPDLPIILATGYAELLPEIADRLLKLNKPFFQRDLAEAIGKVLGPA